MTDKFPGNTIYLLSWESMAKRYSQVILTITLIIVSSWHGQRELFKIALCGSDNI